MKVVEKYAAYVVMRELQDVIYPVVPFSCSDNSKDLNSGPQFPYY